MSSIEFRLLKQGTPSQSGTKTHAKAKAQECSETLHYNPALLYELFPHCIRLDSTSIATLLASTRIVGMRVPGLYSIYSSLNLVRVNSSLGNHLHNHSDLLHCGAQQSAPHSQGVVIAQSNTANTRIVCGEIQDSKAKSESTTSDSKSISESTLSDSVGVSETYPQTNLESSADSKLPSGGVYLHRSENQIAQSADLKGVVGVGSSSRGEGASLPNLQVWISPAASSSPSPLDKKERDINEVLESKEVKALDSKKLDCHDFDKSKSRNDDSLESHTDFKSISDSSLKNSQVLESTALDSQIILESYADFKPISESTLSDSHSLSESSLKDSIVSKANLESSTLVSKTLSESTPSVIASERKLAKQSIEKTNAMDSKLETQNLDCHDFAFTKSRNDDKAEYSKKLELESKRLAESAMLADSKKLESSKALGFQKVKAKDSKKQSLESRQDSQTQKARGAETQKIDLESKKAQVSQSPSTATNIVSLKTTMRYTHTTHPLLNLTTIRISTPMQGTIKAFIRPQRLKNASLNALHTQHKSTLDSKPFASQRALVIGAGSGLGNACAKLLYLGGAQVCASSHSTPFDEPLIPSLSLDVLKPSQASLQAIAHFAPTHLYYFATPRIRATQDISKRDLSAYLNAYIFAPLRLLELVKPVAFFQPSSVFVEELPLEFASYSIAKGAMEYFSAYLRKQGYHTATPRLPKVATNQTLSLIPQKLASPADSMLRELLAFTQSNTGTQGERQ